jgi:trehalose 2-sulfotransferase
VFGVKCFSLQLRELQQRNPALLREVFSTMLLRVPATRVIVLKRRDRIAHAVSYARSALSGIWRKEQEAAGAAVVDYSAEAVEQARAYIEQQEADWDLLLKELSIEPLTMWYEDLVEEPDQAVRRVAEFIGVQLDPAASVDIPEVEKQAEEDSMRWRDNYTGRSH